MFRRDNVKRKKKLPVLLPRFIKCFQMHNKAFECKILQHAGSETPVCALCVLHVTEITCAFTYQYVRGGMRV